MTTAGKRIRRIWTITQSIALIMLIFCGANSCSPDLSDDPIPYTPFDDIVLNLSLPSNIKINTNGGFMETKTGGVRGLIIYRENATNYKAFEKNCSYHPNEAAATVSVDASTLYMIDHSCGSVFRFPDGEPGGGIAWRPLRQYVTFLDGNELIVTDEIVP